MPLIDSPFNNSDLARDMDKGIPEFLNYSNVGYTIDSEGNYYQYRLLRFIDLDKNPESLDINKDDELLEDCTICKYHFYTSKEQIKEDIQTIFKTTGILIEEV